MFFLEFKRPDLIALTWIGMRVSIPKALKALKIDGSPITSSMLETGCNISPGQLLCPYPKIKVERATILPRLLDLVVSYGVRGPVLEAFGLGGLSEALIEKIREIPEEIPAVITGQPTFGGLMFTKLAKGF